MKAKVTGVVSRGVQEAYIDDIGHLIFEMTDGRSLDLGLVVFSQEHAGDMKKSAYDPAGGERQVAFKDELHSHANVLLLDSYAQTETDLADAVQKKHSHSNKALLDSYTQTEANIADSVSKKHSHSNKSTLDGITDTDIANIAAALSSASTANATANTAKSTADAAMPKSGGTFTGNVHAQNTTRTITFGAGEIVNASVRVKGGGSAASTRFLIFERKA